MKNLFASLGLAASASLLACTADTGTAGDPTGDGAAVFAVPTSTANATVLLGVWETTAPLHAAPYTSTARFELRADHLVSATHCTADDGSAQPITVGVRVPATITSTSITVQTAAEQTQPIGANGICGVKMGAGSLPACDPSLAEAQRKNCFALANNTFSIYQSTTPLSFTKIAD